MQPRHRQRSPPANHRGSSHRDTITNFKQLTDFINHLRSKSKGRDGIGDLNFDWTDWLRKCGASDALIRHITIAGVRTKRDLLAFVDSNQSSQPRVEKHGRQRDNTGNSSHTREMQAVHGQGIREWHRSPEPQDVHNFKTDLKSPITVKLPCVRINLFGSDGQALEQHSVLLDKESEISFIKLSVVRLLNPHIESTQERFIGVVNGVEKPLSFYGKTSLAISVPWLNDPIKSVFYITEGGVDVLIGRDICRNLDVDIRQYRDGSFEMKGRHEREHAYQTDRLILFGLHAHHENYERKNRQAKEPLSSTTYEEQDPFYGKQKTIYQTDHRQKKPRFERDEYNESNPEIQRPSVQHQQQHFINDQKHSNYNFEDQLQERYENPMPVVSSSVVQENQRQERYEKLMPVVSSSVVQENQRQDRYEKPMPVVSSSVVQENQSTRTEDLIRDINQRASVILGGGSQRSEDTGLHQVLENNIKDLLQVLQGHRKTLSIHQPSTSSKSSQPDTTSINNLLQRLIEKTQGFIEQSNERVQNKAAEPIVAENSKLKKLDQFEAKLREMLDLFETNNADKTESNDDYNQSRFYQNEDMVLQHEKDVSRLVQSERQLTMTSISRPNHSNQKAPRSRKKHKPIEIPLERIDDISNNQRQQSIQRHQHVVRQIQLERIDDISNNQRQQSIQRQHDVVRQIPLERVEPFPLPTSKPASDRPNLREILPTVHLPSIAQQQLLQSRPTVYNQQTTQQNQQNSRQQAQVQPILSRQNQTTQRQNVQRRTQQENIQNIFSSNQDDQTGFSTFQSDGEPLMILNQSTSSANYTFKNDITYGDQQLTHEMYGRRVISAAPVRYHTESIPTTNNSGNTAKNGSSGKYVENELSYCEKISVANNNLHSSSTVGTKNGDETNDSNDDLVIDEEVEDDDEDDDGGESEDSEQQRKRIDEMIETIKNNKNLSRNQIRSRLYKIRHREARQKVSRVKRRLKYEESFSKRTQPQLIPPEPERVRFIRDNLQVLRDQGKKICALHVEKCAIVDEKCVKFLALWVAIVNDRETVYETYVRHLANTVIDIQTRFHGLTVDDIKYAQTLRFVRRVVLSNLADYDIIVGDDLETDMKSLEIEGLDWAQLRPKCRDIGWLMSPFRCRKFELKFVVFLLLQQIYWTCEYRSPVTDAFYSLMVYLIDTKRIEETMQRVFKNGQVKWLEEYVSFGIPGNQEMAKLMRRYFHLFKDWPVELKRHAARDGDRGFRFDELCDELGDGNLCEPYAVQFDAFQKYFQ